jgi:hypothetical protein
LDLDWDLDLLAEADRLRDEEALLEVLWEGDRDLDSLGLLLIIIFILIYFYKKFIRKHKCFLSIIMVKILLR